MRRGSWFAKAHRPAAAGSFAHPSRAGVTLIELVLVVTLTGLVAGALTSFFARPMLGYQDLARRTALVDLGDGALRRMARDIHAALPNSVRISPDGRALELLHTADGARYRDDPGVNVSGQDHTAPSDWLDPSMDDQFNVLGRFPSLVFTYSAPLPPSHRLAIYGTGASVYVDAATGANPGVITPAGTAITIDDDADEDHIALSSPFGFRFASPRQRLYVVDTPMSYLCDLPSETLTRFEGYPIASLQPTDPAVPPLVAAPPALVADHVAGCVFRYDPGTASRAGLVTIELTLADAGEQVRLLRQVHVDNTP